MKLEESKTQEILKKAFLRESAAFTEYSLFAEQAKKEGLEEMFRLFNTTATNEKAHAEIWFKLYHTVFATKDNLLNSADLEKYEYSVMYKEFAKIAKEEGFNDIATLFEKVGEVEKAHEKTFKEKAKLLEDKTLFSKNKEVVWKCANCGTIVKGNKAPDTCPVCSHPQGFFFQQN